MDNPEAHEFARRQELALAWKEAENKVRELAEDVSIPGIGLRRVQLVYSPSFEPGYSWDLREVDNGHRLYSSQIIVENNQRKLSGYRELLADPDALMQFMDRLRHVVLPIAPDFSGGWGFDGTLSQLSLFGDLSSEVRFQWWKEGPSQWQRLIAIATEMINSFLDIQSKPDSPIS